MTAATPVATAASKPAGPQPVIHSIDLEVRAGDVMRRGRIELTGTSAELKGRIADIEEHYLSSTIATNMG